MKLGARPLAGLLATAIAFAGSGCGASAGHTPTGAELTLQRSQLALVIDGLREARQAVRSEVAAARAAWPSLADGLPPTLTPSLRRAVGVASARAKALSEPAFITNASRLTGPAAGVAGLYETFARLSERAWRLTKATIETILKGSSAAASFARSNSSLYIDAIYDSHYDLSLLGKSLSNGYRQLGGGAAFGPQLTPEAVDALSADYSIGAVRLSPHPGPGAERP